MKFKLKLIMSGAAATLVGLLVVPAIANASSAIVYNNIANPQPGNVGSVGNEAYSTAELGGQVGLAGTKRTDPKVTVLMSSWGCENGGWNTNDCVTTPGSTFSHPITLNIYAVGASNAPGALLATQTQTFNLPYRPSADNANCTLTNAGKWFNGTTCFNGLATPISFSLPGVTLPDNVIISVAYNTSHHGYAPLGEQACFSESGGCGYDSLNVGTETSLSVGTQPLPNDAYAYSTWSGFYCVPSSPVFKLDSGCWTGYQPSFKVEANDALVGPPTSKDQCKNDGWKTFNNPSFKNKDKCIDYVKKHSPADTIKGVLTMSGPSQKIKFNISDNNWDWNWWHKQKKDAIEYWNYDYPGGLHYKANVLCVGGDKSLDEARVMFQIPPGYPGLSGLYVVVYVKDVKGKHAVDLYGHNATADQATAQTWCETGAGFAPGMYTVTSGKIEIN